MSQNNGCQRKKSITMEIITDSQLTELQKTSDVLFSGKIVLKNDGGFKKLYDLPSPALLDRLKHDSLMDVLSIRVKHRGWLCNRDSGWTKNMCILFSSNGLLFIYVKPTKGYVVKLSYALKLEVFCGRKKISNTEAPAENCTLKLKFGFGSIEVRLNKKQIDKWRQPLIGAFDGKLPCFGTLDTTDSKIETHDAEADKVDSMTSTCSVALATIASSSSSDSLGVASLFKTPPRKNSASSESAAKGDLYEEYATIKQLLAPSNVLENEPANPPKLDTIEEETSAGAKSKDQDSGVESDEEVIKKTENNTSEFRPIPPARKSIREKSVSFIIPPSMKSSPPKSMSLTTHLPTAKTSPRCCKMDNAFSLPVYRLETEHEKLSRREHRGRIAEKIRYFEDIGKGGINKVGASLKE